MIIALFALVIAIYYFHLVCTTDETKLETDIETHPQPNQNQVSDVLQVPQESQRLSFKRNFSSLDDEIIDLQEITSDEIMKPPPSYSVGGGGRAVSAPAEFGANRFPLPPGCTSP